MIYNWLTLFTYRSFKWFRIAESKNAINKYQIFVGYKDIETISQSFAVLVEEMASFTETGVGHWTELKTLVGTL